MDPEHTEEVQRRLREAALDRTLAQSFPASDPPSTLPNPEDESLLPYAMAAGDPEEDTPTDPPHGDRA